MSLNGQLQDQLSQVRGKVQKSDVAKESAPKKPPVEKSAGNKKRHSPAKKPHRAPVPSANAWIKDGEDHINIGGEATTELGKRLNRTAKSQFTHDHLGSFKTIEGFTYYIQNEERDDRLRRYYGSELKELVQVLKINKDKIRNFKAIMIDTYYQRILSEPALVKKIIANDLPFDVYFTIRDSGVRQRPTSFGWMISGLNEIRRALRANEKPNLTSFMDDKKSGIYQHLLASMGINAPVAEKE